MADEGLVCRLLRRTIMKERIISLIAIILVLLTVLPDTVAQEKTKITMQGKDWDWSGKGNYRMIVAVPPGKLKGRKIDKAPARILLDIESMPASMRNAERIDADSIEVMAYNPKTGMPIRQRKLRNRSVYDIAHRWDDFDHHKTQFYYHRHGNGRKGNLIWNHTQVGNKPSHYAIYFNLVKKKKKTPLSPMFMIGDGDAIYAPDKPIFAGLHYKVEVVDWDNDGLLDFLLSDSPGYLQWYRNIGTKTKARFDEAVFLKLDGKIFQQKWLLVVCATDWDDDGDLDLIYCKSPKGRVFYAENIGTRSKPRLASRGRVKCDGKPLKTPGKPFPDKADPSDAWGGREYTCTPTVVDWDGDGDKDLLLGSYSGGQVYLCENTRNAKGVPVLTWRGFLKDANGRMIDSEFAASPEIADFDGDGDLDMVLGADDRTKNAGAQAPEISTNLLYYENIGSRTKPKLIRRKFPDKLHGKGLNCCTVPSVGDIDNDGDLDLIIGTFRDIHIYTNMGTAKKPYFRDEGPLKSAWNPIASGTYGALFGKKDGGFNIFAPEDGKFKLMENTNTQNPPEYTDKGFLKFGGREFKYVAPLGDPELFIGLGDLDQDGLVDLLYGTGDGHVWFCRNMGEKNGKVVFGKTRKLMLKDGSPVKVGRYRPGTKKATDFATHSGDRPSPGVADFDGDGDMDLMVADAYGGLSYFENIGGSTKPVFASRKILKKEGGGRARLEIVDWDKDGKPDILFCQGSRVFFWRNIGSGKTPVFKQVGGNLLKGHAIPYAHARAVDWNMDGDKDLLVFGSYPILYYFERSYVKSGLKQANFFRFEKKQIKTVDKKNSKTKGKPVISICKIEKKIYASSPKPQIANMVSIKYIGRGVRREEIRSLMSSSDLHDTVRRRTSDDNGRTWSDWKMLHKEMPTQGDFSKLHGPDQQGTGPYDPVSGRLIKPVFQRVIKGDPKVAMEVIWSGKRLFCDHGFYQLSDDNGQTWSKARQLKYEDGPDFDDKNWGSAKQFRTNEMYIGNAVVLSNGTVAITATVPVEYRNAKDEKFPSIFPNNYRKGCVAGAMCFIGQWNKSTQDYDWTTSKPVFLPRAMSSRGLVELDLSELTNGKLLLIMRGSDTAKCPGRKWFSVSKDGGLTWSKVKDMRYDTGEQFYSPASISQTIRHSKTGKLYWVGNITKSPPSGNMPRHPLQIIEIDEDGPSFKKHTLTVIDDRDPKKDSKHIQLSNFSLFENRETHDMEIYLTRIGEKGDGRDTWTADTYKYTLKF